MKTKEQTLKEEIEKIEKLKAECEEKISINPYYFAEEILKIKSSLEKLKAELKIEDYVKGEEK